MTNTWCSNYIFSFTCWRSDYELLTWTSCEYCVSHVENKTRNAFFIVHISSLITITITYNFKTIRIIIEQVKINSTLDIPYNSLSCFEMCHSWCLHKSTQNHTPKRISRRVHFILWHLHSTLNWSIHFSTILHLEFLENIPCKLLLIYKDSIFSLFNLNP
jgi:hypothetical protein